MLVIINSVTQTPHVNLILKKLHGAKHVFMQRLLYFSDK